MLRCNRSGVLAETRRLDTPDDVTVHPPELNNRASATTSYELVAELFKSVTAPQTEPTVTARPVSGDEHTIASASRQSATNRVPNRCPCDLINCTPQPSQRPTRPAPPTAHQPPDARRSRPRPLPVAGRPDRIASEEEVARRGPGSWPTGGSSPTIRRPSAATNAARTSYAPHHQNAPKPAATARPRAKAAVLGPLTITGPCHLATSRALNSTIRCIKIIPEHRAVAQAQQLRREANELWLQLRPELSSGVRSRPSR